jgi:hypothetical protein
MTSFAPHSEYQRRRELRARQRDASDRRHLRVGAVRVGVVVIAVAMAIAALGGAGLSGWWLLAPAAAYFVLGGRMQRLEEERGRLGRAVAFYEKGLARLDGNWAGAGESGERFLDPHHIYARDLDLFGPGSLFELLCRARSRMGEETLAAWLLAPAPVDEIALRQEGVAELAQALDLREDLAIVGEQARAGLRPDALAAWGERPPVLEANGFRWVARGLSVIGAAAACSGLVVLAALLEGTPVESRTSAAVRLCLLVVILVFGAILWRFRSRTERVMHEAGEAAADLRLLAGVLARIEAARFSAPRLTALRAALDVDGRPPSARIARLARLIDLVDSRHNVVMRLLGPLLLWDLHVAWALEDWRRRSSRALRRWLVSVGEIEALSSLAGHRYEHPRDVFPTFEDDGPRFEGEGLGHPLLLEREAVNNDVSLSDGLRLLIVSGSNMSGKSTLLRTVGTNAVLAQAGGVVRAARLRLSPLRIGASIGLGDSLREGASRFYAEITRLRAIVDATAVGPPVLFLIDELLHGTNSHDRRIGAEALLRGLVERGAVGLVTTHDLALTHVADLLAPRAANVHFEDHLEGGRMRFDYRLRPGVVAKSNALELMRSVGLDV